MIEKPVYRTVNRVMPCSRAMALSLAPRPSSSTKPMLLPLWLWTDGRALSRGSSSNAGAPPSWSFQ
ncbi:hypothetical protein D3C85_1396810 [compost metagenome]